MLLKSPIQTERLVLRRPMAKDFEALYAMHVDPEVMQFVGGPLSWSREYALEQNRKVIADWDSTDYASFHVALLETDEFLGWTGLSQDRYVDGIHLGFRFRREAWGQGFATEAGAAIVDASFRSLGLPRLVSTARSDNERVARLLKRLGFSYVHPIDTKDHDGKVVLYVLENPATKGTA